MFQNVLSRILAGMCLISRLCSLQLLKEGQCFLHAVAIHILSKLYMTNCLFLVLSVVCCSFCFCSSLLLCLALSRCTFSVVLWIFAAGLRLLIMGADMNR